MLGCVDQRYMPPATTAVVDGSLPSFEIFKIAADKSRTSTETFSALETAVPTRDVMEVAARIQIAANMETVARIQIVANMGTVARMETATTTAGRVVRMPKAARTSALAATISRPVARRKTAAGDRPRSGTTTSAAETLSTITAGSNAPDEPVNRDIS